MGDPEPVECGDRAEDGRAAVIDIIGDADRSDPGDPQRLAGDLRVGEKPLMLDGMSPETSLRRPIQTAFEIGEDDMGLAQFRSNEPERHGGVLDIHQIHVAEQHQRGHPTFSSMVFLQVALALGSLHLAMISRWRSSGTRRSGWRTSRSTASILPMSNRCSPVISLRPRTCGTITARNGSEPSADWATILSRSHIRGAAAIAGSSAPEGWDEMTEERITRVTLEQARKMKGM